MTDIKDINATLAAIPGGKPKRKHTSYIMARLERFQKSLFLTPAQSRAHAQAQLDVINKAMAAERQTLRDAIAQLVAVRLKPVRNTYEIKLCISREAMDTTIGEQAALHIATAVAKEVIRRHRQLVKKPSEEKATV